MYRLFWQADATNSVNLRKSYRTVSLFPRHCFGFQLFHITIYPLHLLRNVNSLRAVHTALIATGTMVGLAEFRHTAVVTYQIGTTGFAVLLVLRIIYDISFVQAFVVMQKNSRNIDAIRTGHTIFAIVAGNGIELHHHGSCLLQEAEIIFGQCV